MAALSLSLGAALSATSCSTSSGAGAGTTVADTTTAGDLVKGWRTVTDGPELPLPDGEQVSEKPWTRHTTWRLVNLWSSTCSPCRREMPALNAFAGDADVQVLGVSRDQFVRYAREFEDEVGAEFPSWMDPDGDDADLLDGLTPRNVLEPSTFVAPASPIYAMIFEHLFDQDGVQGTRHV